MGSLMATEWFKTRKCPHFHLLMGNLEGVRREKGESGLPGMGEIGSSHMIGRKGQDITSQSMLSRKRTTQLFLR